MMGLTVVDHSCTTSAGGATAFGPVLIVIVWGARKHQSASGNLPGEIIRDAQTDCDWRQNVKLL